jgi:hypothetical protein
LPAIDVIAAHSDGYSSRCSRTIRTARSAAPADTCSVCPSAPSCQRIGASIKPKATHADPTVPPRQPPTLPRPRSEDPRPLLP